MKTKSMKKSPKLGKQSKKEVDKKYKGFRFVVLGLPRGHRCGYVRIPKGHTLYKLSYSEQLPITLKAIKNKPVGKRGVVSLLGASFLKPDDRISMDLLFDVHGGITFSGKLEDFYGYWIGFDCAHAGDAKDFSLMDEETRKSYDGWPDYPGDVIRTKEYVEQECKNLIDQIIHYFPK